MKTIKKMYIITEIKYIEIFYLFILFQLVAKAPSLIFI